MAESTAPESTAPSKLPLMLSMVNLVATLGLIAALALGLIGGTAESAPEEEVEEVVQPAIYESMDKPMVATFQAEGRHRYLQLVVQFMTRNPDTVLAIRTHMPAILDALYGELALMEFEMLQTTEGREVLRNRTLELSQTILAEHTGDPGVEQVYFTTFLFQ